MVKWLSEITVTSEESNNFYHYHDNRVMPPHVDEALAKAEGEGLTRAEGRQEGKDRHTAPPVAA